MYTRPALVPLLPLPLAGEGWGEGALDVGVKAKEQDQEPPHPAPDRVWGRLFGRLLPQAREVNSPADEATHGFDAVFSANTLHIMGWDEVEAFFGGLGKVLAADATVVVYGPFNYGGEFTSDSNRAFDASLQARDARMGIRDAEAVDALARAIGLRLVDDVTMPANNRCLIWKRSM